MKEWVYRSLIDEDSDSMVRQPLHEVVPTELFEHILAFLSPAELFHCSQVAEGWFHVISQPRFLLQLRPSIEKEHKILLLGKPTIRWLWSEETFNQREKMSKDLEVFYFSNESKINDFLRKICYDKIKYSNSICGWQREYFVRVFYNRMHYHLNFRIVAYPKEFQLDVAPNACSFILGSSNPSDKFLRRSRRHLKRECVFTPKEELNIIDMKFFISSRRSELIIDVGGEEIHREAYFRNSSSRRTSAVECNMDHIAEEEELKEVVMLSDEDVLDSASFINFVWNKKEGINNACLHSFAKHIVDTMSEKAKLVSPDTFEEEANRIIQRQDRLTDIKMTVEAILIGCIGNFFYPIFLLPFCFYFDVISDPMRSYCPFPLAQCIGVLRFLESIVALLLFTVFGVWGSIVGTSVYSYGFALAMTHLVPKEKPPQCRVFSESGWFE